MKLLKLILLITFIGCSSTNHIKDSSNMSTPAGKVRHYQTTTNLGLHIIGLHPVWGDATLNGTVNQFTQNALKDRAGSVRVIQKDVTRLYLILPPLSFVAMPVVTEVFGEVY